MQLAYTTLTYSVPLLGALNMHFYFLLIRLLMPQLYHAQYRERKM